MNAKATQDDDRKKNVQIISVEQAKALVGQDLGASKWITVSQEMINTFADVTDDHQFIHVDQERAKDTPFGGTIAHGFLILSLIVAEVPDKSFYLEGLKFGMNYGFDKVRFLSPVRSESRIRSHQKLLGFEETGENRYKITTQVTMEIEGQERPAFIANFITMQTT